MLPLFTVAGIRVSLRFSVVVAALVLVALLRSPWALLLAALLVASTLLHELAHAVVAVKHHVRVDGIELGVFGGATRIETTFEDPAADLAIAAAGPLASAVVAIVAGLVAVAADSGIALFAAGLNASVFMVNALPLLPFDGGRVLRAHLASTREFPAATRITARVNTVVAIVIAAAAATAFVALDVPLVLCFAALSAGVALHVLGVVEVRRAEALTAMSENASWALAAR